MKMGQSALVFASVFPTTSVSISIISLIISIKRYFETYFILFYTLKIFADRYEYLHVIDLLHTDIYSNL